MRQEFIGLKFKDLDSRLRGNDGLEITRNEKKNRNRTSRIPACTGRTEFQIVGFGFPVWWE
ncbi:hypothetical protein NEILACOT_05594 [Neisseria lactamica ATCC 23970]|uniref:Uncharacterized protein n=1 Tax=Neisseria lactamica ATCC 23970 TaxID=546265 RepID=D0WDF8_NEILA|nr:hypothetical protein NEILACOT_05594 [Neisseria lactamica ATCC 23970]